MKVTKAKIAVLALAAALCVALSGCMQPINANSGYKNLNTNNLVGWNTGTSLNYFSYPRGMAVDSSGNIYVVDSGNDRVVMIPSGSNDIASTNWVSYPNTAYPGIPVAYTLYAPEGIAVDPAGQNIWIADSGNGRIVHLKTADWQTSNPTFDYCTTVNLGSTSHALAYPTGVAFYTDGTNSYLYATDPGSSFPDNKPVVFSTRLAASTLAFSGPTVAASAYTNNGKGSGPYQFSYPRGIAVDVSGNVYVADETNYWIVKMGPGLTTGWTTLGTRGSGTRQFISPQTIAVDSSGIYVVDSANYWVVKMSDIYGDGWTKYAFQEGKSNSESLNSIYPNWVAVSTSGSTTSIFVSDDTQYLIAEFQ